MNRIFDVYCDVVKRLQEHLKKVKPLEEAEYAIKEGEGPVRFSNLNNDDERKAFVRTYNFDIRTKACDIARILLPAATLTNIGLFCNGRAYQNILTRLYSSELPECQQIAKKAHEALNTVIKRYVERAKRDEFIVETNKRMQALADELFSDIPVLEEEDVVLLDNGIEAVARKAKELLSAGCFEPDKIPEMYAKEFQTNMIAYMLYKYVEHPMRQIREVVSRLPEEKREEIIKTYVGERKHRRQRSGRALEYGYDLFYDLLVDFGIFRDLHRHRMLTTERQRLSTRHGFVNLHPMLEEIGAEGEINECIDISSDLYEKIRAELGRDVAQYPVLFGFKIRFCQGFNDREAQHYFELRTGKQGHSSYREICQKMHKLLEQRAPWRAKMMNFVDYNDYFWSRAESEARQRQKEAKLGIKTGDSID
jgi:thymidylate synthase ThyX